MSNLTNLGELVKHIQSYLLPNFVSNADSDGSERWLRSIPNILDFPFSFNGTLCWYVTDFDNSVHHLKDMMSILARKFNLFRCWQLLNSVDNSITANVNVLIKLSQYIVGLVCMISQAQKNRKAQSISISNITAECKLDKTLAKKKSLLLIFTLSSFGCHISQ